MKAHKFVLMLVSCFTASLIGCAATPKPINLEYTHTQINFPDKNTVKTINKGDIAYLNYNYESKFTYKTDGDVSTYIVFDKIFVPSGAPLTRSILEGKEVLCYNAIRPICFDISADKEHLNRVSEAPGAVWFGKDLNPPIKFISSETYRKKSTPAKIEIVFDSYDQNYLSFIYKEYSDQATIPSLTQPVVVEVLKTPITVNVKNVKMEVTQYTNKTLTFRILD